MIDYLIDIDTQVFLWLNSGHALFWDVVMKMASGKIIWAGLYAALIYAIMRVYGWRVGGVIVIAAIVAVTLADQVTASLLRPWFERLRPANLENPISPLVHIVDGYRAGRYGFPSSHAANTFALATFMSLLFRHRSFTLFMFFWALLNCYSRVYLGVHYPGDLLFGLTIGTFLGWMSFNFLQLLMEHWKFCREQKLDLRPMQGRIGRLRFRFNASDIPVFIGLLTVVSILFCGVSIFL